ncbi:MAG: hypothetical protein NTZ26_03745 [Candidatus Aminicenantes bacterium]|nr:hypothetical protein [Candidatus Aminicenantes bacterium]
MRKKSLIVLSALLVLFAVTSCKSNPEKGLLQNYFHAVTLNDVTTLSTMALEPVTMDVASWKITKTSEEKIEPAKLPDLNAQELDIKKKMEGHIEPVMKAKDALDGAKDEYDTARTGAARAAAKVKVDAAQKAYDAEYAAHNDLKKGYNDAKAAAQKEEDITNFSLGAGQLAAIRDLKGEIHTKDLEVAITAKDGSVKNFALQIVMYNLKDEALNVAHRGRWIIVKFQAI